MRGFGLDCLKVDLHQQLKDMCFGVDICAVRCVRASSNLWP